VYGCTAFDSVFALDPVTGKQLWRRDAGISDQDGGHPVCRGLAFFRAPPGVTDCPTRLLLGTLSNQLIAIDAKTGRLCRGFGQDGRVDLREGLGVFPRRWAHPTSPPTIVDGVAVIGAYVVDNQSTAVPSGVVRGYDAVTGQLKWAFDPGRPDDHGPPPPGQTYVRGTPNAWSVAAGDDELGLVYLPMGNGSPDLFGGERTPQTDRFSTALVAIEARTGKVRWVFQAVHHDLWDYDLAAQPALVDLPTPAGSVPALILATKTGQIFMLDRRNGRPLAAVQERAAPQTDVPGERTSRTQPFSIGMPDFAGPALTERDMWGITPLDQLACRIRFRQARYRGIYTPPRLGKTIRYPGELGGIDWGGVSIDEGRGVLIVNENHMADVDELITRAQAEREGLVPRPNTASHTAPGGPMAGTPYAVHWGPFLSGLGIPCQRPPYGYLTAVDLRTRQVIWRHTLGDARNSGPFGVGLGFPLPLGSPNIGGSLATAGGVVFIAATQDEMFRAIDEMTGKVLWQDHLPAAGHATPMAYVARDGHEYVVIAAGGAALKDKLGDDIVAYRLP
jgi:quinoprotein glucose dehydrogenase